MIIREEQTQDYNEIKELVRLAFESAEHSDGNEYNLVDMLRKSDGFVKPLTLVAEDNGELVGHILFTEVQVGDHIGLALAPLSVLPKAQGKGIGTMLMNEAHDLAKTLGYGFSIVLGSEKYYPRVGYLPAVDFGIIPPFDVPSENFMVLFLSKEPHTINGTVQYVKEMM